MKYLFAIICCILFSLSSVNSIAQSEEISLHPYTGFFSFGGKSASDSTFFYPFNPYGKKNGLSFGACFQLQKISSRKIIDGLQLGYQNFSSNIIAIYYAESSSGSHQGFVKKETKATIEYKYINMNAYFGKRLSSKKIDFDIIGGFELGMTLSKGKLTFSPSHSWPGSYSTATQVNIFTEPAYVSNPPLGLDVRPYIQLIAYYKFIGLSAGYFNGISNYANGDDPSTSYLDEESKVFTRMIRLGVLFRMKFPDKQSNETSKTK